MEIRKKLQTNYGMVSQLETNAMYENMKWGGYWKE